jgi:RNA polymerase sigma factor (sigma-70 family)
VEGRKLQDAALIERARDGDVRAYEELIERHRQVAFRTAYLVTRNAADAEEAAQDGFVKAYYALSRFRAQAPFLPWLLRIVTNEARNRNRSAKRREGLALRVASDRREEVVAPSPEAVTVSREAREALLRAVDGLGERDRLVIAYRYFLDLSEAETAEALGVRRGTVKSRLSRGRDALATILKEDGHE